MKMKALWGVVATATLTIGMLAGGAVAASATYSEGCIPKDAWTEIVVDKPEIPAVLAIPEIPEKSHTAYQRYSWVGGPITEAPAATPPGPDWQANTENYEGAGHGDDPIGSPFPKNENGKADWFFWTATKVIDQAYVAGVPGKDAVPAVTHPVEHPAVTCDAPPLVDIWVTWETPVWFPGLNGHVGAPANAFPQSLVGIGQIAPTECETTYQQDRYVGRQAEIDAVLADHTLTGPPSPYEDGGIVEDWRFISTDACPPPPPVAGVPALFSADPLPPNCDTAGSFSLDGDPTPNVDVTVDPALDGPGIYTLTATALNGYTFEGGGTVKTRTIEILGATGFQSDDPEAACYLEPEEPPVDNPPVDNPPVDTPVDNPPVVTPAVVTVTHTTTTVPAASTTKTLAVTGGEETPWLPIGGFALLLAGIGTLVWRRIRA